MSDIPSDLVDKMMVRCGRRCCICRRFRPAKLQVHHIVERNKGGSDAEDNLIVTCLTCHSDVHTHVPFMRRFSTEELKGHRNVVIKMVEEGKLPVVDTDDTDVVIATLIRAVQALVPPKVALLPEAAEMLLGAVKGDGQITVSEGSEGLSVSAGADSKTISNYEARIQAKYKHGVKQLARGKLVERIDDGLYEVTYSGFLVADEILATGSAPVAE